MISTVPTQLPSLSTPRTGEVSSARGKAVAPFSVDTDTKSVVPPAKKIEPPIKNAQTGELSDEQQKQVERLKKTDQEVRTHEAAHQSSGGQYAGNATYSYTVGPDGKRYATGGEVPIDVAPIKGDPEATLAKLDVVIAAALAPAKPSGQDRKVAAAAVAARNQARLELLEKKETEEVGGNEKSEPFDINDFGNVPVISINKAYENSIDLSESNKSSGENISVTS